MWVSQDEAIWKAASTRLPVLTEYDGRWLLVAPFWYYTIACLFFAVVGALVGVGIGLTA